MRLKLLRIAYQFTLNVLIFKCFVLACYFTKHYNIISFARRCLQKKIIFLKNLVFFPSLRRLFKR